MKKVQDRISNQADLKVKSIEESRKSVELQIEVLTRTNGDLLSRFHSLIFSLKFFLEIANGKGILKTIYC